MTRTREWTRPPRFGWRVTYDAAGGRWHLELRGPGSLSCDTRSFSSRAKAQLEADRLNELRSAS